MQRLLRSQNLRAVRRAGWARRINKFPENRLMTAHCVAMFLSAGLLCLAATAADRPVIDVWPGKPPGDTKEIGPEEFRPPQAKQRADVQRLTNVSRPTLTLYQPPEGKRNGTCVIVLPGGGYSILAWDLEGTDIAEWLNSIGVTAAVLKYRVPRRDGDTANKLPLMDAQRSMSLVRSK